MPARHLSNLLFPELEMHGFVNIKIILEREFGWRSKLLLRHTIFTVQMIKRHLPIFTFAIAFLATTAAFAQEFSAYSPYKSADGKAGTTGTVELSWKNDSIASTHLRYRLRREDAWIVETLNEGQSTFLVDSVQQDRRYWWSLGTAKPNADSILWFKDNKFLSITPGAFTIVAGMGKEEAGEISWAMNYDVAKEIDFVVISYCTKLKSKDEPWVTTEPISAYANKYVLPDLIGNEKYVFKIGTTKNGKFEGGPPYTEPIIWGKSDSFTTDRTWGLFRFLVLIGALGIFIYGMKVMSEGLQQAGGSRMRKILSTMTANRFKGVLSGFLITGLVQSSSATTVMTVSFVNAGLMTLVQSAGIMMGANIGTTVTGWLVSFFGFKVSISAYALVIVAIGAPMLFVRSSKLKAWGNTLVGFAILFMGLDFLKDAVPSLGADSAMVQFFLEFSSIPVVGTLMFVALGTLVTIIIQSSSAAMALTMTLMVNGVLPFEVAAAMILGENIGTTITAEIAAMIANVHAKRSARIHSMFNIIGVTWMVFALPLVLKGIAMFMDVDPFGSEKENREAATAALAAFHTVFNATNVLLLIWFVPFLVKVATKTVKSRGEVDEEHRLEYIDAGLLATPELSVMQAKKEAANLGELTVRMSKFVQELLASKDPKFSSKMLKKIQKYEEITDRVQVEISDYLQQISEGELSARVSGRVRSILSIANDLERIGDIFFQMSKTIERKQEEKLWFTPEQRESMTEIFELVDRSLEHMHQNLQAPVDTVTIKKAKDIEFDLNRKRNDMRSNYLKSIESGEYSMKSGMIYSDLFSSCEKVGDHVINVTEAIVGEE